MDEINRYFLLGEQFPEARHRIRSAQTLVIDEIGMLSELFLKRLSWFVVLPETANWFLEEYR
jgi:DNA replication protein DnaC